MPRPIPTYRPKVLGSRHAEYDKRFRCRWAKRFYDSPAWKAASKAHLAENPLCVACDRAGRVKLARLVHHIIPIRERPDLALVRSNFESSCWSCHSRHHMKERAGHGGT